MAALKSRTTFLYALTCSIRSSTSLPFLRTKIRPPPRCRSTSLAVYVFAGRYFLRGLMAGSVKG